MKPPNDYSTFLPRLVLHVEDGDMQALGADDAEARVGVAEHQDGVGLHLHHELVGLGNAVAHRFAEVVAYGLHVNIGVGQLQVLEEYAIEVIIVILSCMCQQAVEILAAFIDDGCKTDNLGASAYDNQQL